ncbi:MAG: hypothetical protein J6Y63_01235 [Bacteroidales bacterium]|nr:hypothetical protein [Bacteroidales bacterium]
MENKKIKDLYEAPTLIVVEVKQEGIICASGDIPASMDGTWYEEDI